jgi:hypothetical protein
MDVEKALKLIKAAVDLTEQVSAVVGDAARAMKSNDAAVVQQELLAMRRRNDEAFERVDAKLAQAAG